MTAISRARRRKREVANSGTASSISENNCLPRLTMFCQMRLTLHHFAMRPILWLPLSSALILILTGCANNGGTGNNPLGTGPFDSAGQLPRRMGQRSLEMEQTRQTQPTAAPATSCRSSPRTSNRRPMPTRSHRKAASYPPPSVPSEIEPPNRPIQNDGIRAQVSADQRPSAKPAARSHSDTSKAKSQVQDPSSKSKSTTKAKTTPKPTSSRRATTVHQLRSATICRYRHSARPTIFPATGQTAANRWSFPTQWHFGVGDPEAQRLSESIIPPR